jgi:hypothetical protein
MKIFVDEEYGYRLWCWEPVFASLDELINWWKQTMTKEYVDDFVFYDVTEIPGEWQELNSDEQFDPTKYDGQSSIHTSNDTFLVVDGYTYSVDEEN